MKKLLIYLLCASLFFQTGLGVSASEQVTVPDQSQIENSLVEKIPSEEGNQEAELSKEKEEVSGDTTQEQETENNEESQTETEEILPEEPQAENDESVDLSQGEVLEDENEFEKTELEENTLEDSLCEETEEQEEQIEPENEDPQYGRENGYIDESFFDGEIFLDERSEYVHNDRFSNHEIRDVIDVSKYQGTIDWNRVKKSGIDYAMIRVGFRGYGQSGTLNMDTNFQKNIEGALNAGIQVGVYIFSQAITEQEAVEEAEYVMARVADYDISLPVVIDFEYASSGSGLTGRLYNAHLSKNEATKICRAFCRTVENKGYQGMVYANKDMLENNLNASEIAKDYQIWLAHYTSETSYAGEYDFWQYTQSGKVDGISGNVDKSFWYQKQEFTFCEIPEGMYTISASQDRNKVLDIPGASYTNGVNAQIYTNNGSWAQKFYIRLEGEDTYVILSANSGKVLEASGNRVCQNDYTGALKQQWRFIETSEGKYSILSADSGKVMSLAGGLANKTAIQLKTKSHAEDQIFSMLEETESAVHILPDGCYFIETALQEDKVVTRKKGADSLEINLLSDANSQKIQLTYLGDGRYRLSSVLDQKVLCSENGNKISFKESSHAEGTLEEQWIIKLNKTGNYSVISVKDGKNLDVAGAKTANGTVVQKYAGNGTKAQQFQVYETFLEEQKIEDGIYIIHSALSDSKVLDINGASKKCDGNVQLYTANGTDAQKFIVEYLEDGTYTIKAYHSGMAMAVKDGKNVNKTNVLQYFPIGGKAQNWKIISAGKGFYRIISEIGGKALDISGASTKNGANVQIYDSNGTKAQKFRFEKIGEISDIPVDEKKIEDGTYSIITSLNEKKVLDVSGGSKYSGANVQIYTSNNSSAQQFVIKKDSGSVFYQIYSKKSGMNLTFAGEAPKNSANVFQNIASGDKSVCWELRHVVGDYYMIFVPNTEFCLDLSGGKTADKTNVQIYTANNSKAQIFQLKKLNNQVKTEQNVDYELKEGLYTVSTALNSSMVLDVASASKADGANIQLYKSNQSDAQKYLVKRLENGNYTLTVLCSQKLVTSSDSNVYQNGSTGTDVQEWQIIPAGDGYYTLLSSQNGKALDVKGAKANNGANIQVYTSNYTAAQRFRFTTAVSTPKAEFVETENNHFAVSYKVYTKGNDTGADGKYYLMQSDCYTEKIYGSPLASAEQDYEVSFKIEISDRKKLKEIAMDKLVLAVKNNDDTYKAVTRAVSISNPEMIAQNKKPIFKASSKKGLQGVAYASDGNQPVDARYTNTKQTLLNLDLASVVNPRSDYTNFTYKGKTYRFSNCTALKANISSMNAGYEQYLYGNNGTTKVSVSLCLLLGYNSANSYLIDPAAREQGHSYYLMNVREQNARETLEAAFVYLSEIFGQEDCYVTNWILGNEVNSSRAWNYAGNLDFDSYMNCYTTAFGMLYRAVKSEKTGNTVSISLDNGWTAAPDTYAGKAVLDSFAKKIHAESPDMEWSIAYHAYSYPLTRVDFWNDYTNTSNSMSTRYISMNNITVLTNYAASLEKTYKKPTGSIRILLTEQGYSYSGGSDNQAMAIARGYYLAEFNNRIDAFIIRAIVDDSEEAAGRLYFGLMNSQQEKRTAFYVYEYMDGDISKFSKTSAQGTVSSANYAKFNSAKRIVCNTNWKSIVPGFNASKLAGIK